MNDEKKDLTPEQAAAEAPAPEEKEAAPAPQTGADADVRPEGADAPKTDDAPDADDEGKDPGKKEKEKRRFGRKPSREDEKIEALEKEKAELNDKFLRICAEYDNFRRRSQKEKESLYGDIRANTVTQFLPVYDNLERALRQETQDEAYKKGVEMIMTQFCTTLQKLGVEEINCLGEKFDPTMHNAVMHVDDEEKGENEIVEVFQKGFKLGDKVIRFAMVKVAN